MSKRKRNRKLNEIASNAILEVGSDYYRKDSIPVIERPFTFTWKNSSGPRYIEQEGRRYYLVSYPYDNEKEDIKIAKPYLAQLVIWADNGEIAGIYFGNGLGFNFFIGHTYEHAITENVYPNLDYDKPVKSKIHMPFQYQQYHSANISGEDKALFNSPLTYITGTIKDVEGNPVHDAVVVVVDSTGQRVAEGLYRNAIMEMGIDVPACVYDFRFGNTTYDADMYKFIHAVSGLCVKEKSLNFLVQHAKFGRKKKAEKNTALISNIILLGSIFVVMILILLVLSIVAAGKEKQYRELEEYNNSPIRQAELMDYEYYMRRNTYLMSQYEAIEDIDNNIVTYPTGNSVVLGTFDEWYLV